MYEIWLDDIKLPVLPEKLNESIVIDNKSYDILSLGERTEPGKTKLRTLTISSYIPMDGPITPIKFKEKIESIINPKSDEKMKPLAFGILRFNPDGSASFMTTISTVLIESIEWEDRAGEPGDLYYTIKLKEWKPFGGKIVSRT